MAQFIYFHGREDIFVNLLGALSKLSTVMMSIQIL